MRNAANYMTLSAADSAKSTMIATPHAAGSREKRRKMSMIYHKGATEVDRCAHRLYDFAHDKTVQWDKTTVRSREAKGYLDPAKKRSV